MKKQLFVLIALSFHISVFGQIKTPEIEIRSAATSWLNEISGPTTLSGSFDVSEIPGSLFLVSPQITSNGGQNYERGLRVLMTDAYGIPAGVVDTGYRIGIDISAHANEPSFEGTLQSLQGMRIQFGTNSDSPTGTINEVRGLNLQGLTSSNAVIGNAYAIYQSGATFKNYFQANVGIGSNNDPQALLHLESDLNDMSRLLIDIKGASNNTGIELKASSIAGGSNWISATGDLETDGFVIKGNGFMGLGTNSPAGRLHISSSSVGGNFNNNYDNLVVEHAGAHMGITLKASGTYRSGIAFGDEADDNSGRLFYDHNSNSMAFYTNDVERMRILDNGDVGIGTTAPIGRLHVYNSATGGSVHANFDNLIIEEQAANIGMTFLSRDNQNAGISFSTDQAQNKGLITYVNNDEALTFHSNSAERMRINAGGRVSIGTTSSIATLDIKSQLASTGGGEEKIINIVSNATGGSSDNLFQISQANEGTASNTYGVVRLGDGYTNSGIPDEIVIRADGTTYFDGGKVGIGKRSASYELDIDGVIRYTSVAGSSDRRWKRNIRDIHNAKLVINQIRPVSFHWREDEFPEQNFDDRLHHGVIAQELEEVLPELVRTDNEGYKSVDYQGMIGLLVKGFQERGEEIERLNAELSAKTASNKDELATLESRLARLEALLGEEVQESKDSSTSEK